MRLQSWLGNGWLAEHDTSPEEVADLLSIIDRDLGDSAIEQLSPDWRMGIAYNATLQLATLALAAAGYRPGRERAHERAVQSLRFTVALDQATIDVLDSVRRKRNTSSYDRAGMTSAGEAAEIRDIAVALRKRVVAWLQKHHPELLSAT